MNQSCPISNERINEKAARLNGLLTAFFLFVFIISSLKWVIFFLTGDFLIRGFLNGKKSPVAALSKKIVSMFNIKPVMVNAGPKKFAAKTGFFLSFIISVLYLTNSISMATFFAVLMVTFALLEACFGFCLGCVAYSWLIKANIIKST